MPKKNKITSQTPKRTSSKVRNTTRSENSVCVKRPRRYKKRDPNYRFPLYDDRSSSPSPDRELESVSQPSTSSKCKTPDFYQRKDGSWKFDKDYMKIIMNAYKDSPDWRDLKAKRFNTSFLRETPRGDRDIQIFTPEEEADPMYQWPDIGHPELGLGVEPGSVYVNQYLEWLDLIGFPKDEDEKNTQMMKKKEQKPNKRGRKPKYKHEPFSDEQLDNLTNWDKLLQSDSEENEDNKQEEAKQTEIKGATAKIGKRKTRKIEDSDNEYKEPNKSKKQKQKQGKCGTPKKCSRLGKKIKENGEPCSMELNKGGNVLGKDNRRKSTRNVGIRKYLEIDSDSEDNATIPISISTLNSDASSSQNASKSKSPKVMMDKGEKKKTLFTVNLLPFEKAVDNRVLRVHLYKNIDN